MRLAGHRRRLMVRFENYWETDVEGHNLPYLDEIIGKPKREDSIRLTALRTGQINLIDALAFTYLQHRWAKGSIQTAKKLLPRVLQADVPHFTKCQAVLHLTNYLVHPLMLWNVRGTFVRTPKFRIEHPSDTWVEKRYRAAFPWLSLGESCLAVYHGYGVDLAVHQRAYLLIPFLLLYTLGFAAVAGLSLYEGFQAVRLHMPSRTRMRAAADRRM